jgi:hypothetical protein
MKKLKAEQVIKTKEGNLAVPFPGRSDRLQLLLFSTDTLVDESFNHKQSSKQEEQNDKTSS